MANLTARLAKLEGDAHSKQRQAVRHFAIEGPADLLDGAAVAFLRSCGHEVCDADLNIIRVFIGAEDGRPVDLPLRDLTRGQSLNAPVAALPLHMQPGQG